MIPCSRRSRFLTVLVQLVNMELSKLVDKNILLNYDNKLLIVRLHFNSINRRDLTNGVSCISILETEMSCVSDG